MSWQSIYVPKKEGDLGLKRIEDWSKAAILKHIWNIFDHAGSLWVAWVKENILKGRSFYTITESSNSSWGWNKILKLKKIARSFLHYAVGNGKNNSLWHDWRHHLGVLFSVLVDKQWIWRPAISEDLVSIHFFPSIQIGDFDKPS